MPVALQAATGAVCFAVFLAAQAAMLAVLLSRLARGRTRRPPVPPRMSPRSDTTVSVLVPTLNEARGIRDCVAGLMAQVEPLLEVLVVDSQSRDGTRDIVQTAALRDPRIRLLNDPPLPPGWIGKVWALESGWRASRGAWVLGIDADTIPNPGLVGAVIDAAEEGRYDVVSFSPQFTGQRPAERLVQPAMLVTLIYRTGAAGAEMPQDRVLANGQCFLVRRRVLEQHGGYGAARASFSDDVTLARHFAAQGARVGFLDGSRIIQVCAYSGLREMWREWGRSFDLKDSSSRLHGWMDVLLVWMAQALPLPVLLVLLACVLGGSPNAPVASWPAWLVLGGVVVNAVALFVRFAMLFALRESYAVRGISYWLSWLFDAAAAYRLTLSMARRPTAWRGRRYPPVAG